MRGLRKPQPSTVARTRSRALLFGLLCLSALGLNSCSSDPANEAVRDSALAPTVSSRDEVTGTDRADPLPQNQTAPTAAPSSLLAPAQLDTEEGGSGSASSSLASQDSLGTRHAGRRCDLFVESRRALSSSQLSPGRADPFGRQGNGGPTVGQRWGNGGKK